MGKGKRTKPSPLSQEPPTFTRRVQAEKQPRAKFEFKKSRSDQNNTSTTMFTTAKMSDLIPSSPTGIALVAFAALATARFAAVANFLLGKLSKDPASCVDNRPDLLKSRKKDRPRIAFLGDSITQGSVSGDFTKEVGKVRGPSTSSLSLSLSLSPQHCSRGSTEIAWTGGHKWRCQLGDELDDFAEGRRCHRLRS